MMGGLGRSAGLVFLLAWTSAANAGGLRDGHVAISGERLTTFGYTSISGDVDEEQGAIALFGRGGSLSPYDMPRLAFDAFVTRGLSVGGSLTYQKYFLDPQELDIFLISPRVGYAIGMGDMADFWLKGGISYYSTSTDAGVFGNAEESGLAFSGAFDFVIAPAPHFGILVGPSFDVGLTGERSSGAASADIKYTTLALNMGLVGWF
ncbi:MAG TPA: hypothetical protein VHO25_25155 [Polyangiaceae bacterium]|nr:hypothetical protein [Polyangiaceae bacterium]